jgi:hypothetical protein
LRDSALSFTLYYRTKIWSCNFFGFRWINWINFWISFGSTGSTGSTEAPPKTLVGSPTTFVNSRCVEACAVTDFLAKCVPTLIFGQIYEFPARSFEAVTWRDLAEIGLAGSTSALVFPIFPIWGGFVPERFRIYCLFLPIFPPIF